MSLTFTSAFLLGFFSTIHCIGMCGGIIGALSLGLPPEIRNRKSRLFHFILSYNIGRLLSYSTAGLIAGAVGTGVLQNSGFTYGHGILRAAGVFMMVIIGIYLMGWLPQLASIEKIGGPVWKKLEPFGRKLMPVTTISKALVYGLIWGWLPCGLVYFVLIWALTTGSAINGALTMLAFGAGTLPSLLAAGFMASWITRFSRSAATRQIVGMIIIIMAIGSIFIPMEHHQQTDNNPEQPSMPGHQHHLK